MLLTSWRMFLIHNPEWRKQCRLSFWLEWSWTGILWKTKWQEYFTAGLWWKSCLFPVSLLWHLLSAGRSTLLLLGGSGIAGKLYIFDWPWEKGMPCHLPVRINISSLYLVSFTSPYVLSRLVVSDSLRPHGL